MSSSFEPNKKFARQLATKFPNAASQSQHSSFAVSRGSEYHSEADVHSEIAFLNNEVRNFIATAGNGAHGSRLGQDNLPIGSNAGEVESEKPSASPDFGVVLFVDISGFTELGKRLKELYMAPARSTEAFGSEIIAALQMMTSVCLDYGGDVAKFAGDALLCTWKVDRKDYESLLGDVPELALAKCAALAMLKRLGTISKDLKMHGGIGLGNLFNFHLVEEKVKKRTRARGLGSNGFGMNNPMQNQGPNSPGMKMRPSKLEQFDGILKMNRAETKITSPDEITKIKLDDLTYRWHLVTGEACTQATDLLENAPKGSVFYKSNNKIKEVNIHSKETDFCSEAQLSIFIESLRRKSMRSWTNQISHEMIASYVPRLLQEKLQGGGIIGGELKSDVATIFVSIDSLVLARADTNSQNIPVLKLKQLNSYFSKLVYTVRGHGGEIRDLLFDDKGCIFIAVFGAHQVSEQAALKAVTCANQLIKIMPKLKIGVAVGENFVGMCGVPERHDFVVIGDSVNLAARLCGGASAGRIIVSAEVAKLTLQSFNMQAHEVTKTKRTTRLVDGILIEGAPRVTNFKCFILDAPKKIDVKSRAELNVNSHLESFCEVASEIFVGRERELSDVGNFIGEAPLPDEYEEIHKIEVQEPTKVVSISGAPGIGKTALLNRLRDQYSGANYVFHCAAFELDQGHSFSFLKHFIFTLLGIPLEDSRSYSSDTFRAHCEKCDLHIPARLCSDLFKQRNARKLTVRSGSSASFAQHSRQGSKITRRVLMASSSSPKLTKHYRTPSGAGSPHPPFKPMSIPAKTELVRSSTIQTMDSDGLLDPSRRLTHASGSFTQNTRKGSAYRNLRRLSFQLAMESPNDAARSNSINFAEFNQYAEENSSESLSESQSQEIDKFLRELIQWTSAVSAGPGNKVIISIDDLHWIDRVSLAAIYGLLEAPLDNIIFIVTHRSRPLVAEEEGLVSFKDYESELRALCKAAAKADLIQNYSLSKRFLPIKLDVLNSNQVFDIAGRLFAQSDKYGRLALGLKGRVPQLSASLQKSLIEKSNGIPQYVLILINFYLRNSTIVWNASKSYFTFSETSAEGSSFSMPGKISDIVNLELNALEGMQSRLIKMAAFLGKSFAEEDLWTLSSYDAMFTNRDDMIRCLESIERLGFIRQQPRTHTTAFSFDTRSSLGSARDQPLGFDFESLNVLPLTPPPPSKIWEFVWEIYFRSARNRLTPDRKLDLETFLEGAEEEEQRLAELTSKRTPPRKKTNMQRLFTKGNKGTRKSPRAPLRARISRPPEKSRSKTFGFGMGLFTKKPDL